MVDELATRSCGAGTAFYVSPNIDYATRFCSSMKAEKEFFEVVLFVRVLPTARKVCDFYSEDSDVWVIKGEPDDDMEDKVRVVAFLFKARQGGL